MTRSAMIVGIETEYSLIPREGWQAHMPDYDRAAVRASTAVLESIRTPPGSASDSSWQHIANGSRFYLDGRHPELSTPECRTPRDLVAWDAAGERIIQEGVAAARKRLPYGASAYKRLTDGFGRTWGCHENYCITRPLFFQLCEVKRRSSAQSLVATFFVVRQLLVGAGKVGHDAGGPRCAFQISQRADFVRRFRGQDTMINRPLIQERDEPHADRTLRRFHVICGDANRCQWATYLKVGLTSLLLLLLSDEEEPLPDLPVFDDDYGRINVAVSRDPGFGCRFQTRRCAGERLYSVKKSDLGAIDVLAQYVDALAAYARRRRWGHPAEASAYREVADKAVWATSQLRTDAWRSLYGWLDWPTKRVIIEQYLRKKGRTWSDALTDKKLLKRLKVLADIAYTALDPAESKYQRLVDAGDIRQVIRPSEVARAVTRPPEGRATYRALLASAYERFATSCDWERVEFTEGSIPLVFSLMDPLVDDAETLAGVIRGCSTPFELHLRLTEEPIPGIASAVKKER